MPRPPRLDAPGTVHHVWSRAVEGRPVFAERGRHQEFLDRLTTALGEGGAGCFAWAIMSNHFHAVVRSGHQPLGKIFHRVLLGFAVAFNRRSERQGHVFQSCFQSRRACDDSDVMGLIRYVHRNPFKAGIVATTADLADYAWCGHGALLGRRPALPFESVSEALSFFSDDPCAAREQLAAFMDLPDEEPASALDRLVDQVCLELGVAVDDLRSGLRDAKTSRARTVICGRAITLVGVRKLDIARAVGVTAAAVSQALKRAADGT
jgi:REP element-mobilizing transposase RayT